jgi:hypothetical protein
MNPLSCEFPTKVWLTDSERLGPTNEKEIEYSVKVTAGKKIRFNVRDSVNPGYEGTAFSDVITISELEPRLRRLRLTVQLQEAITLVSKALSLVQAPSLCKLSQCMSAYISTSTPTRGSGNTDASPPFFGTTAPSSPGGILPSPLAEASAALSSQLSLASSIASSTATGRNGDGPVNGNAPNSGFGVGLSFALVFGSILGIWGAFILTMW